jgi:hypothetical protein
MDAENCEPFIHLSRACVVKRVHEQMLRGSATVVNEIVNHSGCQVRGKNKTLEEKRKESISRQDKAGDGW